MCEKGADRDGKNSQKLITRLVLSFFQDLLRSDPKNQNSNSKIKKLSTLLGKINPLVKNQLVTSRQLFAWIPKAPV